jgi:hypothetical protein
MQICQIYTITAGTPINLATGTAAAPVKGQEIYAFDLSIQMQHGGTGRGYVMDGVPIGAAVLPTAVSPYLSYELAPATATAPGVNPYYKFVPQGQDRPGVNIHEIWIDGSNSGDTIIVSYNRK